MIVKPIRREKEEVDRLEKKVREVPNFLGDHTLWEIVTRPGSAFFTVDDVGLMGAIGIRQGYFGDAHITFWDGELEGKAEVCSDVAEILMESAGLQLLFTTIPKKRMNLLRFATEVGFEPFQVHDGLVTLVLLRQGMRNGNR